MVTGELRKMYGLRLLTWSAQTMACLLKRMKVGGGGGIFTDLLGVGDMFDISGDE